MTAPLSPTAAEARRLLEAELAKAEYQASKPNLVQRLASAFFDWLSSLKFGNVQGAPALALIVLLVVVVAAIVVLFLIYGMPRLNRRSTPDAPLFGDDDRRDSDTLRESATRAAAVGDFATATVESFRAVARSLGERGILTTSPGTTAHAFGERASAVFPGHAAGLRDAARAFDAVRYLDRAGNEADYSAIRSLDATLDATPSILDDRTAVAQVGRP